MTQTGNMCGQNNYQIFVQRFTQYFQQEIKCEDSETTLQTIITLMDKCGLKDLLDSPKVSINPRHVNTNAHQHYHQNSPGNSSGHSLATDIPTDMRSCVSQGETKKKSMTNYFLFLKEKKEEWEMAGKPDPKPDFRKIWKSLRPTEQALYKERVQALNSQ